MTSEQRDASIGQTAGVGNVVHLGAMRVALALF